MRYPALLSVNRARIPRLLSRVFKAMYALLGVLTLLLQRQYGFEWVGPFIGLLNVVAFGCVVVSYILSLTDSFAQGEIQLEGDALALHPMGKTSRRIPRHQITSALVVQRVLPHAVTTTVEVTLRGGDRHNLRVDDVDAANALVRALGFGPDGARLHVDLAKPSRRVLHLPIGFVLYMVSAAASMTATFVHLPLGELLIQGLALLHLTLYFVVMKLWAVPKAVVGRDGVIVRRGPRARSFRANDPALLPALRGIGLDDARAAAVVRAASERASGAQPNANVFARGELSVEDWRRRIASGLDGGYRMAGNVGELAKAVLASGDVRPDERIGAALALRVSGDVDSVQRAAAATADERVRVALDAVANGDDETVETRLRRLS